MLYQERPEYFETVIANLVSDEGQIQIGPTFEQQTRSKKSVPDLAINQQGFAIYFETKLSDWFYSDQIERHLKGIAESKAASKVIFLLGNIEVEHLESRLHQTIELGKSLKVLVQPVSFEAFIQAFEAVRMSESFEPLFEEFKEYLDHNGLLPQWKYLLDVVNCVSTMHEIEFGVYICPDTGGAYRHQRAKFFGPYKDKEVSQIRLIRAVASVSPATESVTLKWKNSDEPDETLEQIAKEAIFNFENRMFANKSHATQVFILGEPHQTKFVKSSKGGMMSSKRYFRNAEESDTAESLAQRLNGESWT